jgi:hypothetical protein
MSQNLDTRYAAFIGELTALSRRYGFYIQATGGVYSVDDPAKLASLQYSDDLSSGDLLPIFEVDEK